MSRPADAGVEHMNGTPPRVPASTSASLCGRRLRRPTSSGFRSPPASPLRPPYARSPPLAPDIRWPNDLLLSGRKLGGILTELNAEVTRVRHAVIGIGINVHQPSFPPELAALATSLKIETGRDWSRQDLLVALLRHLHQEIERLTTPRNLEAATADIRKRLIARLVMDTRQARNRH